MATPIPIEFKLSDSKKVKTGLLHGYDSYAIRIEETGVITYYSLHFVDWVRKV